MIEYFEESCESYNVVWYWRQFLVDKSVTNSMQMVIQESFAIITAPLTPFLHGFTFPITSSMLAQEPEINRFINACVDFGLTYTGWALFP